MEEPRFSVSVTLSVACRQQKRWPSDPRGWYTTCQQEQQCVPPLPPHTEDLLQPCVPGSLTHQTGQITTSCRYQETSQKTGHAGRLHHFQIKEQNAAITTLHGQTHWFETTSIRAILIVVVFLCVERSFFTIAALKTTCIRNNVTITNSNHSTSNYHWHSMS